MPLWERQKVQKCCLANPDKNSEIIRARSIAHTYEELYQIIAKPMDVYRLKVELIRMGFQEIDTEVSRTFEIEGKQTLYDLHIKIQHAFDWDNDHMFSFYLRNVDELTSSSRRTDLGRICSISDHKS